MNNPGCGYCKHMISIFMLSHCSKHQEDFGQIAQNYNRNHKCSDFKHSNIILRLFRVRIKQGKNND